MLAVYAGVAGLAGRSSGPSALPLFITITLTWSICDLLTAALLTAKFVVEGRLAFGIVGAGYACSGLITWPYLVVEFGLYRSGMFAIREQPVSTSLSLIWHALFALLVIGAFAFEGKRPVQLGRTQSARIAAGIVTGALAVSACVTTIVLSQRRELPGFVLHGTFQPVYWAVAMPATIVATAAACGTLLALGRRLHGLPLWIGVAMFASLLDTLVSDATPRPLTWSWYAAKSLVLVTASVVLIFMLRESVRVSTEISRGLVRSSRQAAARMRALWQIATSEGLSENDHVQMILEIATANIRSDRSAFGFVSHLDGGVVTVDAIARYGDADELDRAVSVYAMGTTFSLASDVHAPIYAAGRTAWWIAARAHDAFLSTTAGLRSVIGTPIPIGNKMHFLVFGLPDDLHADPFAESDVAFVDVIASNISHRFHQRSQLERLQFQIEHDALTALFTRTQFQRFGRAAAADGTLFGIVVIDLDRFREINERAGQMVGDELLIEIAAALQAVSNDDVLARLAGDDFAVLLRVRTPEATLEQRLEDYASVFRHPFHSGDRNGTTYLPVNASLGAVQFAGRGLTFEEALTRAYVALDNAKEHGGARGIAFGPDLEVVALQRAMERDEILDALRDDQFVLEYQPTFRMSTGDISGAEALLRWQHPVRGRLQPSAFLSAVRRANLLGEATAWIVARIARDFEDVRVAPGFRVYFNVPAQVLESETFLLGLERTLAAHPGFAEQLGVEITESEAMNRVERAIEALERVRRLGLLVAIDDFGTGYSSLSYLKRLPIDVVKLDKSFIDGIPDDPSDVALAEMFLALTRQFGLTSVGEGIETDRQAAWLREHGCQIGQGYLFSRPVALDALLERIRGAI